MKTSDIVMAAALIEHGSRLVNITLVDKRGVFHLEVYEPEHESRFLIGDLFVEPRSFNNQIRNLNTAIRALQSKQTQ